MLPRIKQSCHEFEEATRQQFTRLFFRILYGCKDRERKKQERRNPRQQITARKEVWLTEAFVHFAGLYETRGTCFELMDLKTVSFVNLAGLYDGALVAMDQQTAQLMQPGETLQLALPRELEADEDLVTIPGFGVQRNEMAETPLIAMAEAPLIEMAEVDTTMDMAEAPLIEMAEADTTMDSETALDSEGGTALPSPKAEPVALGPGRRNKGSVAGMLTCPPENLAPSGLGKRGRRAPQAKNSVSEGQAGSSRAPQAESPAFSAPAGPQEGAAQEPAPSAMAAAGQPNPMKVEHSVSRRC